MKTRIPLLSLSILSLTALCNGARASEAPVWTAEDFFREASAAYSTNTTCDFTIVDRRKSRRADSNDVPRAEIAAGDRERVRWIAVPGLRNVRDIGGWTGLRSERVYRGSAIMWHELPNVNVVAEAPRTRKVLVDKLGLRAELDLRGEVERVTTKTGLPKHALSQFGIRPVFAPLGGYMGAFKNREMYRKALLAFADAANFPIYVHCAGGADRTGTVIFLLEAICGVPEWKMDVDYELTGLSCFNIRSRTDTGLLNYKTFKDTLRTNYVGTTINEKAVDYCRRDLRLSDADIAAIRRNLTFPGDGLWKASPAMWRTPKTHPIASMNTKDGVKAMAVEGEPYRGRPTRFFAYWGLPAGASPTNRVPGIVLVHGGAGTAFAYWVKIWTDRGYAAIAMDNCGGFPQSAREFGGQLRHRMSGPNGWGHENFPRVDEDLADQWTYHAVSTVIRSHSFLRSLPEVRADAIGVTGISWGGYLTACVAGIDDRFRFAAPVYGCAYLRDHSVWSHDMADRNGRVWDELWDARNFLPNAKMPVLWTTGSNDHFFPLDSLQRGCDLLPKPPALAVRVRMPHGHPPTGDPREIRAFADHFCFGRPAFPDLKATREGGRLSVSWNAFGRKVAKAEFVSTASADANWEKRPYVATEIPFGDGSLAAEVPAGTVLGWVNLTFDDGLVASTRNFAFRAPTPRSD